VKSRLVALFRRDFGHPAGIVCQWGWQNAAGPRIYTDPGYLSFVVSAHIAFPSIFSFMTMVLLDHRFVFTGTQWFKVAHAVHHDSRPPTAWAR